MDSSAAVPPKPVPYEVPDESPYWVAAAEHTLALQRCSACDKFVHPPRPGCPFCQSPETTWVTIGDQITGTIYTFVTVYRAFDPSFNADVPYIVALCDVDQAPGVRITANVIGDRDGIEIGNRVKMTWEDRPGDFTAPQWELSA